MEQEQKAPAAQLSYRVATVDDAAVLQRLIEDSFRHPASAFPDASGTMARFSMPLDRMRDRISAAGSEVIAVTASDDTTIVACYQLRRKTPTLVRFAIFAVDPRCQGRGLARLIMQHAEDRARHVWGATTMQLNTLSSRGGLLAWYRRCGYAETGVREEAPAAEEGLHFVVLEKELEAAGA